MVIYYNHMLCDGSIIYVAHFFFLKEAEKLTNVIPLTADNDHVLLQEERNATLPLHLLLIILQTRDK
jgi:hypothetical protein